MSGVVVGFTGTQAGCAKPLQFDRLREELWWQRKSGAEWLHMGDCVGSDNTAALLWEWMDGKVHVHPPTVRTKRAFFVAEKFETPMPYLARNREIVAICTILIATPGGFEEELRSGTWATIRHARKLGRELLIIWPDGSISHENIPAPVQS